MVNGLPFGNWPVVVLRATGAWALDRALVRTFADRGRRGPLPSMAPVRLLNQEAFWTNLGIRGAQPNHLATFRHHPGLTVVNARFGFMIAALRFASATFSEKFAPPLLLPFRLVHLEDRPLARCASESLP